MALFLVVNAAGEYLCLPEANRYGATAKVKPFPAEWGNFDNAARFPSAEVAVTACINEGIVTHGRIGSLRVITLQDAWRN